MVAWAASKGFFPSILLLRRYTKIVARYCEQNGYMDLELSTVPEEDMPFDVRLLPTKYPPLEDLTLWISPPT